MSKDSPKNNQSGWVNRFLSIVETVGNALPHPATLFGLFALGVVILSWIASQFDISVVMPGKGTVIHPVNLLSVEGIHRIIREATHNFTGFAPLGVVLVAMLGIGVAEGSGLIGAGLRKLVILAPARLLTFVIVFAGVLSNTASEVGYVLLVPLGAVIFLAADRHPIAGLAAAFAGVSGGYSANFFLGTVDPLLAGLSQEAAQIVDPAYTVNPAANYYFMFASTLFIALAGTFVTERIVEPRLGKYTGKAEVEEIHDLNDKERRGLRWAGLATLALTLIVLWGILPADGFLRSLEHPENIFKSPFISGIVTFIFLFAALAGIAYGLGAGTFKNDSDIMKSMGKSMSTLGIYMVLCFFAAQFVAYFKWTNLGLIFAVEGAEVLKSWNLGPIPLMVAFVILSAAANMFMGSASAKWAILAPVFIPMFMLLGYAPELVQVAYRIGDSVTNIISPMMSYFALIVAFMERYDEKAGIGTIIATMLPYTLVFLLIWTILLMIWLTLGIPLGPDSHLFMETIVQ
ncbi:MAG TPA: AbgT family transporter [Calditrichia bacterium]|nr:AbgT family transporter [Calditrichia bacterium]